MPKAKTTAKKVVKAKATRKKKADTFDWNNVGENVMKNAQEISKNIMKNAEQIGKNIAKNSARIAKNINDYTAIK